VRISRLAQNGTVMRKISKPRRCAGCIASQTATGMPTSRVMTVVAAAMPMERRAITR